MIFPLFKSVLILVKNENKKNSFSVHKILIEILLDSLN